MLQVLNPFKANGLSDLYQFEESILNFMVVW